MIYSFRNTGYLKLKAFRKKLFQNQDKITDRDLSLDDSPVTTSFNNTEGKISIISHKNKFLGILISS